MNIVDAEFHMHNQWIIWLILVVLLALALFVGYTNFQIFKPFRIETTSALYPEQAIETLQAALTRDGWEPGYRDTGTLIMTADAEKRFATTPAIATISRKMSLSRMSGSQKQITVEFDFTESSDGSIIIANGNKSGDGTRAYIADHLRRLPKVGDSTVL